MVRGGVSVTGHLHPRNTQPGSEHTGVLCARGPMEVSCARCGIWGMSAGGSTPLGRSPMEMLEQMGVDDQELPDFGSEFFTKKPNPFQSLFLGKRMSGVPTNYGWEGGRVGESLNR